MATFPSLPLFTDSWIAKTHHLTRAERGMYIDLLVLCWESPQCRAPNEMTWIRRKLCVADHEVEMLKQVIAEFMICDGNWLWNKRLLEEYEHIKKTSKSQSGRSKSRWYKEKTSSPHDAARHQSGNAPNPNPNPSEEKKEVTDVTSKERITPRSELLTALDGDHAQAVIEHRQRIKRPLTAHAAKLLAGKFARCPDPNAAADVMIAAGWQGFEPAWLENRARGQAPPGNGSQHLTPHQRQMAAFQRKHDELASEPEAQADSGPVHGLPCPGTHRQ